MSKELINQAKLGLKTQISSIKQESKSTVPSKQDIEQAKQQEKKIKVQIKSDEVDRKKAIKRFNIEKKRSEKINKIRAKWQFKEESLLHSSDMDIFKYDYKVNYWKDKNFEKIAILKALYKYNMMLAREKDVKEAIKQEYVTTLKSLKPNKEDIKAKKADYKVKLKQMKQAKKQNYKKEHSK